MKKLTAILMVLCVAVTAFGGIPQGSETWSFTHTALDGTTTAMTVSDYYKPNPTQNSAILGSDNSWTGASYYQPDNPAMGGTGDDLGGLVPSQVGNNDGGGITNRGCSPHSMEAFRGGGAVFLNLVNDNPTQQDNNYNSPTGQYWSDGINDYGQGWDLRHGYKLSNNAMSAEGWANADDTSASKAGCINPLQLQETYGNNKYMIGQAFDSKDNPGRDAGDMLVTLTGCLPGQVLGIEVVGHANADGVKNEDFAWGTLADGAAVNPFIIKNGLMLFPAGDGYGDVAFACSIGDFTADASGTIQFYLGDNFFDYDAEGGDARTILDGVYIVPEPTTMALLGLGGLFLRRRK